MKLHHFSPYLSEDEVVIDPTEASTRRQKYSKAEFKESGVHRTFFYVDPSQKEGVVWGNHYTAEIPDDKVYNLHADKDGHVRAAEGKGVSWLFNRLIEAGHHAARYTTGDRDIVAAFVPVKARRVDESKQLARDEEEHNFQVGPHKYTSSFVDDGAGGYGFEFRRHQNGGNWKDQYRLRKDTEPKHALQVFREVIHHARDFVHKHEPPYVYFEADQTEPERERFYRTLARRAKELHPDYVGHELPNPTSWGTRMFVLVHKEHMDDAKMKGLQQLSRWTSVPTPFGYRHFAHFETPGGKYTARIKQSSDGVHKLEFGWQNPDRPDELHYGMTGAGHGVEVMKKMVELVHGYLKEKNPKTLLFEADPNEHGRVKLYHWLTSRVHKIHPDYEGEHLEADPGVHEPHQFILKRREAGPQQLARWQPSPDGPTHKRADFDVHGRKYRAYLQHNPDTGISSFKFELTNPPRNYSGTSVTGTGHGKAVFDHVIDLIDQHIREDNPHEIGYSADAEDASRVKLYKYFGAVVKKRYPQYVTIHVRHPEDPDHKFHIVRKEDAPLWLTEKRKEYPEVTQLSAVNDSLSDQGRERRKLLARLLVEAKLRPVALGNSYAMHLSGLQAGNYAEVLHNNEPDAVGYVGHYYGLLNGAGSPDLHLFHEGEGEHKLTVFDTPMKTDNLYEALGPVLSQSPMVRVIPKDGFNRVAVVNLPDSGILKNANASNVQQFSGQYATLRHRSSPGSSASARETHRDAIRAYEQSQSA